MSFLSSSQPTAAEDVAAGGDGSARPSAFSQLLGKYIATRNPLIQAGLGAAGVTPSQPVNDAVGGMQSYAPAGLQIYQAPDMSQPKKGGGLDILKSLFAG